MCSLCGVLGGNEHWTDAAARPGVFTRNHASVDRRHERAERVRAANEMLSGFGLVLADWQGASFVLSTKTGRSEIIEDLGHLWPAAERFVGRPCDPLDLAFIARMETRHVG